MTDKERDNLLISMSKQMKEIDSRMNNRDELLINMSNNMNKMNNDINKMNEDMNKMEENMNKMSKDMDKMKTEMKEVKEEQRNLSRAVAKIEVKHGEKLQILLDVVTGQEEKNKEFEKRFEEDEKILSNHDDEIYYLKEKIG